MKYHVSIDSRDVKRLYDGEKLVVNVGSAAVEISFERHYFRNGNANVFRKRAPRRKKEKETK